MANSDITTGLTFKKTFVAKKEWAADIMGSGGVPVLGTPALILAIENLAFKSVKNLVDKGFTTVGTKMDITHLYPTAVGDEFCVELLISKCDGFRLEFAVTSTSGGKVIASGFHRRNIVDAEKFMERLKV